MPFGCSDALVQGSNIVGNTCVAALLAGSVVLQGIDGARRNPVELCDAHVSPARFVLGGLLAFVCSLIDTLVLGNLFVRVQYHLNGMYQEALSTYSLIVKNKQYPQSGRLRVNMGNIYFEQVGGVHLMDGWVDGWIVRGTGGGVVGKGCIGSQLVSPRDPQVSYLP